MRASASLRFWFCTAVAVVAAALADPAMEFASNAGTFGPGTWTDGSNLNVVPTLCAGLLLAGRYLYLRVRRSIGEVPNGSLRASVDGLRPHVMMRLIPAIYASQILVVFLMETAEQFVLRGHAMGGTVWLGGPAPISLALHGAVCVLATFVVRGLLAAFARTAVRVVISLLRAIAVAPLGSGSSFANDDALPALCILLPVRCRIGERAPPPTPA